MKIADNFKFSQNNLQDYKDCPRRFWYRYIQHLAWPALEVEPAIENERFMRAGSAFHQLVHQYIVGIPQEKIESSLSDKLLPKWWKSFIENVPFEYDEILYPEIPITAKISDQLIMAKFDLVVAHQDGTFTIFDWKTSRKRPKRDSIAARLQSKVYPFVLASMPNKVGGAEEISPDKIKMIYWFTNYPEDPEIFDYSQDQFDRDNAELENLIKEVEGLEGEKAFPLTMNVSRCKFCRYRSLCNRGVEAASFDEIDFLEDALDDFDLDFDQTEAIEY